MHLGAQYDVVGFKGSTADESKSKLTQILVECGVVGRAHMCNGLDIHSGSAQNYPLSHCKAESTDNHTLKGGYSLNCKLSISRWRPTSVLTINIRYRAEIECPMAATPLADNVICILSKMWTSD